MSEFKLDIWDIVGKYFHKEEKWGDAEKLDPALLYILFILREGIGEKFIVHNAYELSGHSDKSYHYKGMAVDGHFESPNFYDTICDMETLIEFYGLENKIGLGIYPQWKNPGFHIDSRGKKARWAYVSGKYVSYDIGKQRAKDLNA